MRWGDGNRNSWRMRQMEAARKISDVNTPEIWWGSILIIAEVYTPQVQIESVEEGQRMTG